MSAPAASKPATTTPAAPAAASAEILPSATALLQAAKLSIKDDKPIKLDFYVDTYHQKAFIGEDATDPKDKVLVKAKDEFTSNILKLYKVEAKADSDFIVVTENSLYIVSGRIQKRKIDLAKLQAEADKLEYEEM
jgi:hypothetical protein